MDVPVVNEPPDAEGPGVWAYDDGSLAFRASDGTVRRFVSADPPDA